MKEDADYMGTYAEAREKTRTNLVSAFWDLYCEKGLNKITIREITDKAGYNRATFYIYFKNTRDVLDYVEEKLYERMKFDLSERKNMSTEQALVAAISELDQNRRYLGVLLSDKGDPVFAAAFREHFRQVITQIVKNGDLIPTVPLDFALDFCIGGITDCLQKWYSQNDNISSEGLVKNVLTVAFSGVFRLPAKKNA